MPRRKRPLITNEIYHIYCKSIAGFKIFNHNLNYERIISSLNFYMIENNPFNFGTLKKLKKTTALSILSQLNSLEKLTDILAYCIMPTHIHLILKQLKKDGISRFMCSLLNSYGKYFNLKHKRKGPLYEGRFQNVLVKDDSQLIHLTRYIHLNPVTASLVSTPEDWKFSSYGEYIGLVKEKDKLCNFSKYFDMNASSYKKFVNDRISYQKKLAKIKHLTFE